MYWTAPQHLCFRRRPSRHVRRQRGVCSRVQARATVRVVMHGLRTLEPVVERLALVLFWWQQAATAQGAPAPTINLPPHLPLCCQVRAHREARAQPMVGFTRAAAEHASIRRHVPLTQDLITVHVRCMLLQHRHRHRHHHHCRPTRPFRQAPTLSPRRAPLSPRSRTLPSAASSWRRGSTTSPLA